MRRRSNHVYFGCDPGSPPYSEEPTPRCPRCREVLWSDKEEARGLCDECHRDEDESERWIDRNAKRTGTED